MDTSGYLRARARRIRQLMRFFDHRTLEVPVQAAHSLERQAGKLDRQRSRAKRVFAKILRRGR
jgi:hypothetical protein